MPVEGSSRRDGLGSAPPIAGKERPPGVNPRGPKQRERKRIEGVAVPLTLADPAPQAKGD